MEMSLLSKLREVAIGLKAGKVTMAYPLAPDTPPARFRGRPIFDAQKCIGCAGCANNCPSREILVQDLCQEVRIIKYVGRRCTFCGRCADVCPEKAITMSKQFETASDSIGDLRQTLHIFMGTCQRCGRCFKEPGPLEGLLLKGYRMDDLEKDLWVYASQAYLEKEPVVRDIDIEVE
jgi:hydrogenase-4 component H